MTARTSPRVSNVPRSERTASGFASRRPSPLRSGRGDRRVSTFQLRRTVIAALLLGPLAAVSSAYSLAVALDTSAPEIAQKLYPDLPRSKVRLGDLAIAQALGADAQSGNAPPTTGRKARQAVQAPQPATSAALAARLPADSRATIERHALSSLADTPYSAGALRQLALIEPDADRRRALLGLARTVSRRDLGATAQLAELALLGGDAAGGLALLDEALSISDALDAQLFPLLLGAGVNPEFDAVMRTLLADDPIWAERFARAALASPQSAASFARAAQHLPAGSPALLRDYGAPLVEMLAQNLQLVAAFEAYAIYSPRPQDASAFGTRAFAPLDWKLTDGIDAGARRLSGGADGRETVHELFAGARRAGEAARIVLRLAPGAYALRFMPSDPRGQGGTARLDVVCLAEGRELATSDARAALGDKPVALGFTVGEGCPYQSLRLGVEAGAEAVSVLVSDMTLDRVQR